MTEEILPNLFRIEIPLPRNPLKWLNSYVVKGPERNLIIDTGMNREECLSAMNEGLRELEIDLTKTDFFITHAHADHAGLAGGLAAPTSTVYIGEASAEVLADDGVWDRMLSHAGTHGFPDQELKRVLDRHPGYIYSGKRRLDFTFVQEGERIRVGNYVFECVLTPGHFRGHVCLYERQKKVLISGDHILGDITPNITLWRDDYDPLNEYLVNLDKVNNLDVKLVLPGHRRLFEDCRGRIKELKAHHEARLHEVLSILADGALNAYTVASRMTWDINCDTWDEFPVTQKWFAVGEAMAHLKYLERKGMVRQIVDAQSTVFSLV